MLYLPIFLLLFAGIGLKYLLPFVFKFLGWRGRFDFVLEERVGAILLLMCSAALASVMYWYPWYVATHHASEDDRYGMVFMFAFPFYFLGAAVAGVALYRLIKAVSREKRGGTDIVFSIGGSVLALVGFSPLLMFAWRMFLVR